MTNPFVSKTVFITGADGFIGSHLTKQLVSLGSRVRALVYYNSWNEIGWLKDLDKETLASVEIFYGDIRDIERVRSGVSGCEYVFHLSSLIAIPYSYQASRSYIDTNVSGALNVLHACLSSDSLHRLLHVSTSEVYGTAQQVPISESHPLVGQSPYSASKIAADKLVESFFLSFGLPVTTARPFNTFGPRQTARAVIPTIASQLLSNCDYLQLGALSPTRDFNYVLDTVHGMLALASCDDAVGQVVNIGTGIEWSIKDTAHLLMRLTGVHVDIRCNNERLRPERSEVNRLIADTRLLTSLTDWKPTFTFEQGLRETVSWIEDHLSLFNPSSYVR